MKKSVVECVLPTNIIRIYEMSKIRLQLSHVAAYLR